MFSLFVVFHFVLIYVSVSVFVLPSLSLILTLFCLANLLAVSISRPYFGINIPRFVSSNLPPTKVYQASVTEKVQFNVLSTLRLFVKPVPGALRDRNSPNWSK